MNDILTDYLQSIHDIPLLKAEEEYQLGLGVLRGDQAAKERLYKANLKLVVSLAKSYKNANLPLMDIIQEGNIGLLKAVERFDCTTGNRFSTFAIWEIRNSISKALVNQTKLIRMPANVHETLSKVKKTEKLLIDKLGRKPDIKEIAECLGMSEVEIYELLEGANGPSSLDIQIGETEDATIGSMIVDPKAINPEDSYINEAKKEILENVLKSLSERESEILKYRFGLNGNSKTLEEVGEIFGLTKERIRQIENKALEKLRNPIRFKMLQEVF